MFEISLQVKDVFGGLASVGGLRFAKKVLGIPIFGTFSRLFRVAGTAEFLPTLLQMLSKLICPEKVPDNLLDMIQSPRDWMSSEHNLQDSLPRLS